MVGRIFSLLKLEFAGVHQAAYLIAFFSFCSQLLALVRDRALASTFGAGETLDIYFASFKIPDVLFAFLLLFVSTLALVPLLSRSSEKEQGEIIGTTLTLFTIIGGVISIVLMFFAPLIAHSAYPSITEQELLVQSMRIMLLQPLLLGISSIVSAIVQTSRQFILFALAPICYNVGIICGIFFLVPSFGVIGLAYGVVFGALLHVLVQVGPLLVGRERLTLSVNLGSSFALMQKIVAPSLPRSLALLSSQAMTLYITSILSGISAGAVSAFTFALNLQSVPLTVIGVSYASAIFPTLAALVASNKIDIMAKEVWAGVRHSLFWLVPAGVLMLVLRAQIVRVVLGSGEFTWSDTKLTAALLALLALSAAPSALILIFSRAYYALGETRIPVFINTAYAVVGALLSSIFVVYLNFSAPSRIVAEQLFRVTGIGGTASLGAGAALCVSSLVCAVVFAVHFGMRYGGYAGVFTSFIQVLVASLCSGVAAYVALGVAQPYLLTETLFGIFAQGFAGGLAGIIVYVLALLVLKNQEVAEAGLMLYRRVNHDK